MRNPVLCDVRGVLLFVCASACEPYPGTDGAASSSGSGNVASSASGSAAIRRPINSEKLCSRLVSECGQEGTPAECLRQFVGVYVTGTCSDLLASASCADLQSSTSAVSTTCFPPCAGTLASCNGDGTITICTTTGTTNVLDCEEACKADGRAYSGTCGTSYGAQRSAAPQCWCQ